MKTVIGIDFGTQSARALLVNADTGAVLERVSFRYPRGILPGNLFCIDDYHEALDDLIASISVSQDRSSIRGICIDATSLTLVCVDKNGIPMEKLPGFSDREQAMVKLWKRHNAQPQAQELLNLARQLNEPFLGRTGGTVSSEWMLPKLLEIRDADRAVYEQIDLAFDLCEYLTWRLTGQLIRSSGSMCYKGLWSSDLDFPSDDCLNTLRSGFAGEYRRLLRGEVRVPGQSAGPLRPEWCAAYGLPQDVAVAVGTLDGHTAQVALGALQPGDAALVIGTSNVLSIQTEKLKEISGICGVAMNGQVSGLCGVDSGQSCTGDMLEWYLKNMLPPAVWQEAEEQGISVHTLLSQKVNRPWACKLSAADWWNGSRNTPCDLTLRGCICGLSLNTAPEDIYLALLQGIVCGTREIIEQCERSGVAITRCLAAGGVAARNPLLMQQYANILRRPVHVGALTEGPALGAAIFAAVAAGIYPDARTACQHMGVKEFTVYQPDMLHAAEYENIFQRNHRLRQLTQTLKEE